MKTDNVEFGPCEISYAHALASARYWAKSLATRENKIKPSLSSFGVVYAGVFGELAARKFHGGSINTEVYKGGDGHRPDLVIKDVGEVEVKTRLYKGQLPKFIFELDEFDKSELFTLVLAAPAIPISAYVSKIYHRDELQKHLVKEDLGYGVRFTCKLNLLEPVESESQKDAGN